MRPVLLLVHGEGQQVEGFRPEDNYRRPLAHPPGDADSVGVAAQIGHYAQDMRAWAYDKSDFTFCLAVDTGTFEEVILAAGMRSEEYTSVFLSLMRYSYAVFCLKTKKLYRCLSYT